MAEPQTLYTLITGASSGLGEAIAARLSQERRLILHGRDTARLQAALARCAQPERHLLWLYDLRDVAGIAPGLGALIAGHGIGVECVVHSAGVVKILPVRNVDHKTLDEVLKVNFISAAEIVSLLVKKRVNQQHLQAIVFISSLSSRFGAPGFSMYCASKGALDGFMRALAVELAPRVRVNSILPGLIRTRMTSEMLADPEVAAKLERDYPLGLGNPEDIVNAVEFLTSDRARWITGQEVVVDGGRTVNISI
jgi:NAD(P)-dependent dehydrogenase (short-subunit alcohol dehydrogenase family)